MILKYKKFTESDKSTIKEDLIDKLIYYSEYMIDYMREYNNSGVGRYKIIFTI